MHFLYIYYIIYTSYIAIHLKLMIFFIREHKKEWHEIRYNNLQGYYNMFLEDSIL